MNGHELTNQKTKKELMKSLSLSNIKPVYDEKLFFIVKLYQYPTYSLNNNIKLQAYLFVHRQSKGNIRGINNMMKNKRKSKNIEGV